MNYMSIKLLLLFFLITWVALWGMGCAVVSMDEEEIRVTWIRLVALKWRELKMGVGEMRHSSCIRKVLLLPYASRNTCPGISMRSQLPSLCKSCEITLGSSKKRSALRLVVESFLFT